jgi:bifunctional non-homologous end joining protein LigD
MSERAFGSHAINVTHPDKVLFPADGIRKKDVIDYYERIAEVMLPHIEDRPLMLQRFPNGIGEKVFYQKNVASYFPDWIKRASVKKKGGKVVHAICNDVETLVYLANLGCITPHMWLSRIPKLNQPDVLIFDLDPPRDDFSAVRRAAFALREILESLGLKGFPMTTGSRGLHVTVLLERGMDFDRVRSFARIAAELLCSRYPEVMTVAARKNQRRDRVYIDVLRNAYAQTAVAPYAIRAKPGAPVAAPLDWDELSDVRLHSQRFNMKNIFRRIERYGDPWKFMRHPQAIDRAQEKLDRMFSSERRRTA